MKDSFKQVGDTVFFMGDKLEIFIPMRYETRGVLLIEADITTLGIFDMKVNGKDSGYYLPGKITMEPTEINYISKPDGKYLVAVLHKNDVFIKNINIIQEWYAGYLVFYDMLYSGYMPDFLKYEDSGFLFDTITEVTGVGFPVDHVVFEMISAMLYRDPDDVTKLYRLSDTKKAPKNIPMRLVSHASMSTTGKIVGAYMTDGVESALVNPSDTPSDLENLLRS